MFDIEKIRADFPILEREVNRRKLVYFDSGATAQKPLSFLNTLLRHCARPISQHRLLRKIALKIAPATARVPAVVIRSRGGKYLKEG